MSNVTEMMPGQIDAGTARAAEQTGPASPVGARYAVPIKSPF